MSSVCVLNMNNINSGLITLRGSINDDISEKVSSLSYVGVKEAASDILAHGALWNDNWL